MPLVIKMFKDRGTVSNSDPGDGLVIRCAHKDRPRAVSVIFDLSLVNWGGLALRSTFARAGEMPFDDC